MKRIIYSFYIDIPDSELDLFDLNILKKGHTPTNVYTKYHQYLFATIFKIQNIFE